MKKLINILLCSLFVTFNAHAVKYNDFFSETFTTVEHTVLFCGKPEKVAYYLGYKYQLLPVSIGVGRDEYNNKNRTVFFAASKDLKKIALMMMYDDNLCVQSISVEHEMYNINKTMEKRIYGE